MSSQEDTVSQELEQQRNAELEVLAGALNGVIEVFADNLGMDATTTRERFGLLQAEAADVASKLSEGETVTSRDLLIHRGINQVIPALHKVIKDGYLTDPEDAEILGSTLLSVEMSPSSALAYFKGTANTSLERRLNARELAAALVIRQDVVDGFLNLDTDLGAEKTEPTVPSIASIVRAADNAGLEVSSLEEADLELIKAGISIFSFVKTVSTADKYGDPVSKMYLVNASANYAELGDQIAPIRPGEYQEDVTSALIHMAKAEEYYGLDFDPDAYAADPARFDVN